MRTWKLSLVSYRPIVKKLFVIVLPVFQHDCAHEIIVPRIKSGDMDTAWNNMMNLLPLVRSSVPSILEDIIDRVGLIPRYYDEHRNVAKKKEYRN